MLASVFAKSLRDQRRSLAGWSSATVALVVLMSALWPSVRDMPDIEQFLTNYPEAMRELFNIESIATGAGFLNAELFSIILPAMFIVFGISRGARLLAGEEEAGTLDAVLVTPIRRARLLLEKAAAVAVSVVVLALALFAVVAVSSAVIGMQIPVGHAAVGSLSMALLGVMHGWLALAVGAASGRRGLSIAVPATVAFAAYLLYVLGKIVTSISPWSVLSPFHQALENGPLGTGIPGAYAWMAVAAVVFVAVALPLFDRRDVATA